MGQASGRFQGSEPFGGGLWAQGQERPETCKEKCLEQWCIQMLLGGGCSSVSILCSWSPSPALGGEPETVGPALRGNEKAVAR